jgi:hypothetical protein
VVVVYECECFGVVGDVYDVYYWVEVFFVYE